MDLGIAGKVAFVTGGSRGIGRQSALTLAGEGTHVAICARDSKALESTRREIQQLGVSAFAFEADMSDKKTPEIAVRTVEQKLGPIDILVNNVGGSLGTSDVLESSEEDFIRVFDLNLWSALRLMKITAPGMRQRGWGRIINVASIYGREHGGTAPYMAAKASMIAVSKHLALSLAKDGVTVNAIAPGSILHYQGSWERFVDNNTEEVVDKFIEQNLPMGRFGWPEPVASTIAFLASAQAGLIVGACVNVDGGQSHNLF